MKLELAKTPLGVTDFIAATAAQNDVMRKALDTAREHEFLLEQCAARGISIPPQRVTLKLIATVVATKHGLSHDDLVSDDRRRPVAWPRQEAMWLARQQLTAYGAHRYSLPQIGSYFGGRDHTTVIHAVREHEKRLARAASRQAAA